MSTSGGPSIVMTEDARMSLADAAASAARRNRPRYLMLLGIVAIVGALIYALTAFASRATASGELAGEQDLTRQVRLAVEGLLATRADEATQVQSARFAPDPRVLATLEQIGTSSALTGVSYAEAEDLRPAPAGMQRKKYTANMTNVDGEAMLKWVTRALAEVQGLEITSIQLNPGAGTPEGQARWSGQIIFTRWERKS